METSDRQLRQFLHIAALKSVSRAADVLGLSQSALSRQLAALEACVGKALFMRTGRGVELTDAGETLHHAIRPAYQAIDLALDTLRSQHGVTQGTITLATVHTLNYYFTAEVVAAFVGAHPEANLSLMGRSSSDVVALVERGKADLGFVYDAAMDSDTLVSRPLFDDTMCLITRDAVSPDGGDLTGTALRFVGFPAHYALRRMIHSSGLQPEFVAEAETVDAMLRLVSSGVGACILPARIPDALLANYALHKTLIERPLMRRRVVAVIRADRPASPLVDGLLRCAEHIARRLSGPPAE